MNINFLYNNVVKHRYNKFFGFYLTTPFSVLRQQPSVFTWSMLKPTCFFFYQIYAISVTIWRLNKSTKEYTKFVPDLKTDICTWWFLKSLFLYRVRELRQNTLTKLQIIAFCCFTSNSTMKLLCLFVLLLFIKSTMLLYGTHTVHSYFFYR